jgi:hypothetical protein
MRLTLSRGVKDFLTEHQNASRLVDDLVEEHMDEIEEQPEEIDSTLMEVFETFDTMDGEITAKRAGVRYNAQYTDLTPEELVEKYEEIKA